MTESMTKNEVLLDVAFLGGGIDSAVGSAHFAAIELDKKFRVVAGCFGRTEDINAASGERHRIASERIYPCAESLLAAEKDRIDAVVILTPTDQHVAHARLFIEQGVPVICEKALTGTVTDSQELAELVERTSGFLSVIFNYTGYPILREIREFIRIGKLGRLHQLNVEMPQEGFLRVDKDMKPMNIQDWRLRSDVEIPVVSLDLGVHLHSIIAFLTGEHPLSAVAQSRSNGHFEGVEDNVMALIQCTNELDVKMWYGKTALGYRNGLRVEVFGTLGAISWVQENPEIFTFSDCLGNKRTYDRGCLELSVSREDRYQRFKAGHPAGFIEALANYYWDIAIALRDHKTKGKARFFPEAEVFHAGHALEGMRLMEAIHTASKDRKWVDVVPAC
jgi:predicted dehydrogenase